MVGFICCFLLIFCGFPFYLEIYKITDIIKCHRYLVIEQNQQLKHRGTNTFHSKTSSVVCWWFLISLAITWYRAKPQRMQSEILI